MKEKRVALVTGCSRGLGRAMVEGLTKRGWRVGGCARSEEAMRACQEAMGDQGWFQAGDVADETFVSRFCRGFVEKMGVPDLVLNNAAVIHRSAPLWELSAVEIAEMLEVNVAGVIHFMRHLMPVMLARGSGVVVNLSSGWGRSTSPGVAGYCATKWAIEGLSQASAQETGGRVAVVALNPGIIDTAMLRLCFGAAAGGYEGAAQWAERAVPFLEGLREADNGRSLTVP